MVLIGRMMLYSAIQRPIKRISRNTPSDSAITRAMKLASFVERRFMEMSVQA